MSNQITGARYLAESLVGCGIDHVFFMDAILRRTLIELEELGVKRMLTHSEIAAAYMADGYARVKNGLGVCMGAISRCCEPRCRITGRLSTPVPRTGTDGAQTTDVSVSQRLSGTGACATVPAGDQVPGERRRCRAIAAAVGAGDARGHRGFAAPDPSRLRGVAGRIDRDNAADRSSNAAAAASSAQPASRARAGRRDLGCR